MLAVNSVHRPSPNGICDDEAAKPSDDCEMIINSHTSPSAAQHNDANQQAADDADKDADEPAANQQAANQQVASQQAADGANEQVADDANQQAADDADKDADESTTEQSDKAQVMFG